MYNVYFPFALSQNGKKCENANNFMFQISLKNVCVQSLNKNNNIWTLRSRIAILEVYFPSCLSHPKRTKPKWKKVEHEFSKTFGNKMPKTTTLRKPNRSKTSLKLSQNGRWNWALKMGVTCVWRCRAMLEQVWACLVSKLLTREASCLFTNKAWSASAVFLGQLTGICSHFIGCCKSSDFRLRGSNSLCFIVSLKRAFGEEGTTFISFVAFGNCFKSNFTAQKLKLWKLLNKLEESISWQNFCQWDAITLLKAFSKTWTTLHCGAQSEFVKIGRILCQNCLFWSHSPWWW